MIRTNPKDSGTTEERPSSGGWAWNSARKEEYSNYLTDPDHLIAVTKGASRSKGANGTDEWRLPKEDYLCLYQADCVEVNMEWGLSMTQLEAEAIIEILDTCVEPVGVEAERAECTSPRDIRRRGWPRMRQRRCQPWCRSRNRGRASPCTGCVKKVQKPASQACRGALVEAEGSRRRWSPVRMTVMETILCASVEPTGRSARLEPIIRMLNRMAKRSTIPRQ